MNDPNQLPHLLKLLSDDSPVVQTALIKALREYGDSLDSILNSLPHPPTLEQMEQIHALLKEDAKKTLQQKWPGWISEGTEEAQLEQALQDLAQYQSSPKTVRLKYLLDQLADEYKACYHNQQNVYTLAKFLFQEKGLQGATEDYYDPRNSNLAEVIERKQGIPISLTCVYILVGARVGLKIEGCNFPQHFLARVSINNQMLFVDCFNQGLFYREQDLLKLIQGSGAELKQILKMNPHPEMIVARVLYNLVSAYENQGDHENSAFMAELLQILTDRPQ